MCGWRAGGRCLNGVWGVSSESPGGESGGRPARGAAPAPRREGGGGVSCPVGVGAALSEGPFVLCPGVWTGSHKPVILSSGKPGGKPSCIPVNRVCFKRRESTMVLGGALS